jgi:hypothetical protein
LVDLLGLVDFYCCMAEAKLLGACDPILSQVLHVRNPETQYYLCMLLRKYMAARFATTTATSVQA